MARLLGRPVRNVNVNNTNFAANNIGNNTIGNRIGNNNFDNKIGNNIANLKPWQPGAGYRPGLGSGHRRQPVARRGRSRPALRPRRRGWSRPAGCRCDAWPCGHADVPSSAPVGAAEIDAAAVGDAQLPAARSVRAAATSAAVRSPRPHGNLAARARQPRDAKTQREHLTFVNQWQAVTGKTHAGRME